MLGGLPAFESNPRVPAPGPDSIAFFLLTHWDRSIYAGAALWKQWKGALGLSLVTQALQLPKIVIATLDYEFALGLRLVIGFLGQSLIFFFEIGSGKATKRILEHTGIEHRLTQIVLLRLSFHWLKKTSAGVAPASA